MTMGSLLGVGGLTWAGGLMLEGGKGSDEGHEAPWLGEYGPFSSERAVAILPTVMCLGSSIVAAAIGRWYPKHVHMIAVTPRFHEMMALPVSLLVAFRFQASYDRWWTSCHNFQDLASRTLSIAEYVSASVAVKEGTTNEQDEDAPSNAEVEASMLRSRFIAILEAYLGFVELKMHGQGFRPHPDNVVADWPDAKDILADWPEDAAVCVAAHDQTAWCSTAMLEIIRRLQDLEILDGDNGSMIAQNVMSLEQVLAECMLKVTQVSPAHFIVHTRTTLIVFCFTLPFALVTTVPPALMVPMSFTITFAFLGSEYVSREMECPFGNDKGDIPVRRIIQKTRASIRQAHDQCPLK